MAEVYRPGSVIVERMEITNAGKGTVIAAEKSSISLTNDASFNVLSGAIMGVLKGEGVWGAIKGATTGAAASVLTNPAVTGSSVAGNKETYDLKHFFTELNIYESIETPFIMGDVTIQDSIELIQTLPIVGGETLKIAFRIPGTSSSDLMDFKEMIVYKISDRKAIGQHGGKSQSYKLHFISKDILQNLNTSVSRSFNLKRVDEMINTILDEYIKTSLDREIDRTADKYKVVVPNDYPFKAIRWLNKTRGRSSDNKADYVFYVASNKSKGPKYFYKSLTNLFTQDSTFNIEFKVQNVSNSDNIDISSAAHNVQSFNIGEAGNLLQNRTDGTYAEKVVVMDTKTKRSATTIKKLPIDDKSSFFTEIPTTSQPVNKKVVYGAKPSSSGIDYLEKHETADEKQHVFDGTIEIERARQLKSFSNIKLNIPLIAGNEKINLGKIIYFNKPHLSHDNRVQTGDEGRYNDKYISGNYLVIRLRHRIYITPATSEYKYNMSLEGIKQNFNETISYVE